MKCPECIKEGKKSQVFNQGYSTTLLGGNFQYYDEDGKYHNHAPNTITTAYMCSNGHRWVEKSKAKCPTCDK